MKSSHLISILATLLLLILHYDWWNWEPQLTLIFGALPIDLVYHVLWVGVSSLVLWFVLRTFWRDNG